MKVAQYYSFIQNTLNSSLNILLHLNSQVVVTMEAHFEGRIPRLAFLQDRQVKSCFFTWSPVIKPGLMGSRLNLYPWCQKIG